MQIPIQITLHGVGPSDAIHDQIRERAEKLARFYDRITSCRVVLEMDGLRKRHGKQFSAHIDLKVPGGEIAVTRAHDEDVHVALRDAFDAARRQLGVYARAQRIEGKRPPA